MMKPLKLNLATLVCTLVCFIGMSCCFAVGQDKPLKVFVLVGQSNMQGHAKTTTLPHLAMDPATKPILAEIQTESGQPRVLDDVWISYLSSSGVKTGKLTTGFGADKNKIGPELTFGIYMQKRIGQPILIIKTAWGGKSINTDFRPPSAGPYVFEQSVLDRLKDQGKDIAKIKAEKEAATGVYYRQTIEHVKKVLADIKTVYPDYDSKRGYELAGMVWFQGWNDMVDQGTYPKRGEPGGYDKYTHVLTHMIGDFRKDLSAPEMPFVIGVIGVGGPTDKYQPSQLRYQKVHQNIRDAMAAPARSGKLKNVVAVLTENYWDLELDALIGQNNQIKNKLRKLQKEGTLNKNDFATTLEKLQAESFSDTERKILSVGPSNQAYHYLGSGKILARIGKAFAEAMPISEQ